MDHLNTLDEAMVLLDVEQTRAVIPALKKHLESSRSEFTDEVARILEIGNYGWAMKKAKELKQVPMEWFDEGLRRTDVRHAVNQACESLLALCENQPKKDRDKLLQQFNNSKQQMSCMEFVASWNATFMQLLSRQQSKNAEAKAKVSALEQLPPNATVGLDHMDAEEQADFYWEANKNLREDWAERKEVFSGKISEALISFANSGGPNGREVYGIDQEMKDEMGLPDGFWPEAYEGPLLTKEHAQSFANAEVEA